MSDRFARRFEALKQEGRGALVLFVTAGDPDPATSLEIVKGLPDAGADIIELGMPFSDPMADGPAIQAAGGRALRAGASMKTTLGIARDFRRQDSATPLVLMGYFNPIHRYGIERFCDDAAAAGVDGLIVVDLPPEEDDELRPLAARRGIALIRLAAPTTDEVRLPRVVDGAAGFVYYVAVAGVTGGASAVDTDIASAVARLKRKTPLPIAVGFGIKTPEQAATVARVADAAVVGTALVQRIADGLDGDGRPRADMVPTVLGFARELGDAVRAARTKS